MSLYLIVYVLLLLAWLTSKAASSERTRKAIYFICLVGLWLMLILRYGQGTDYFAYKYIFSSFDSLQTALANPDNRHSEIGFRLLCVPFRGNYELFIAAVGTFNMLMIHRMIRRYSRDWMLSLLIFYPTYFLTYFFSALRQGMVFALFAGVMIECLEKKNWKTYYLLCAVTASIHMVSLLYLFIPLALKLRAVKTREMVYLPLCCLTVGCLLAIVGIDFLSTLPVVGPALMNYSGDAISWTGLAERTVTFFVLLALYQKKSGQYHGTGTELLMIIYTFGISFYMAVFPFTTIAARGAMLFKGVEIVLATQLLAGDLKFRQLGSAYFAALSILLTCNNMRAYISQGRYDTDVRFYNYPYISLLDDRNEIWNYRQYDDYYLALIKNEKTTA